MAAASAASSSTLLFDQLADLGDPLPPGIPSDEAGFGALVQQASAAAAVVEGSAPLAVLARELVRRAKAAEAAMEEDEVSGVWDWVDG